MFATVQIGTQIAPDVPVPSQTYGEGLTPVKTTGDLLDRLKIEPWPKYNRFPLICAKYGDFLRLDPRAIPLELIEEKRLGFRRFLAERRLGKNTIRAYSHQTLKMLKAAVAHGWEPDSGTSPEWKRLLSVAKQKRMLGIVRHFARLTSNPSQITFELLDEWFRERVQEGTSLSHVAAHRNKFLRFLHEAGWTELNPPYLNHPTKFGIPLDQLPTQLGEEVAALLKWKLAEFALHRPKKAKIRPITAKRLLYVFTQLTGFAIQILGMNPTCLADLIQEEVVGAYFEWAINERRVKGASLVGRFGALYAAVRYHPSYRNRDYSWLVSLIHGLPIEDEAERKKRKALKFIDYEAVLSVPEQMKQERERWARQKIRNERRTAHLAKEEFIFRWFSTLPWRQRNLRECTVSGPAPNLFKSKIPPFTQLDKPQWVRDEEARNPEAEFWLISFTPAQVKTNMPIDLILPKQLVSPLEHYLKEVRPLLLNGRKADTLFVNRNGKPMRSDQVGCVIGTWSLRFTGVRTTPHLLRDSVAFAYLKAHPRDYMNLSKLLWHRNIQTTIRIYGSRFNESSGVLAMEAWLDEREEKKRNEGE